MSVLSRGSRKTAVTTTLVALALLGGCASTTILSSNNPSRAAPSAWTDYASLPVEMHGVVAGHPKADIAGLFPQLYPQQMASLGDVPVRVDNRHIVMYINPAEAPAAAALCSGSSAFRRGEQDGISAHVVAAMCNGDKVVTRLDARVYTQGASPAQLRRMFDMLRTQLWQSLTPGNNHPEQLYPGQMFG